MSALQMLVITTCLLAVSGWPQISAAAPVVVDGIIGEDGQLCGRISRPCKTIKFGVGRAIATEAHVVEVHSGTYLGECTDGGIMANKTLTVRAHNSENAVLIDCSGDGPLFNFTSANTTTNHPALLTLVGLSIVNALSSSSGAAVQAANADVNITECHFRNATSTARGTLDNYKLY